MKIKIKNSPISALTHQLATYCHTHIVPTILLSLLLSLPPLLFSGITFTHTHTHFKFEIVSPQIHGSMELRQHSNSNKLYFDSSPGDYDACLGRATLLWSTHGVGGGVIAS